MPGRTRQNHIDHVCMPARPTGQVIWQRVASLSFLATTCQTMVDVRSVLPVLTCGTHFLITSCNKHQKLSSSAHQRHFYSSRYRTQRIRDNSICCFVGYRSALTYYLLLLTRPFFHSSCFTMGRSMLAQNCPSPSEDLYRV